MSNDARQQTGSRDANNADLSSTEVIVGAQPPADGRAAAASKARLALFAIVLVALAIAGVKLGGALSGAGREATALPRASAMPAPLLSAVPSTPTQVTPNKSNAASAPSVTHKPKATRVASPIPDSTSAFGGRR
ncbi:MAG: hypothetical protein ABW061_12800 [Polyangiaceae bacterium]